MPPQKIISAMQAAASMQSPASTASIPKTMKRIAIFGGSFDPPTISHMQVASETINLLGFDEVRLVPCGARPDKHNFSTP